MSIILPEEFINRMEEDLGSEADSFLKSYLDVPKRGIRINPLKADSTLESRIAAGLQNIPWESHGYYYVDSNLKESNISNADITFDSSLAGSGSGGIEEDTETEAAYAGYLSPSPGKSPFHAAGAYYIQEPSAMAPASYLNVKPKMCVLDLCAAPGGKSTQIASYLKGQGLLVANEIIPDRARILSQNIERMGITNSLVISQKPGDLADRFPAIFDRILVDAPCSGEGMFRKDQTAIDEWSAENVKMCASRQEEILESAAVMLKPGGKLVYSTCTFSKDEDEEQIERFLGRHADYHLVRVKPCDGMRYEKQCLRIFPQDGYGEGHFVAVLERDGKLAEDSYGYHGATKRVLNSKQKQMLSPYYAFIEDTISDINLKEKLKDTASLFMFGNNLCITPDIGLPVLDGLKVLRAGLELGETKKDRFIPSHSFAMALKPENVKRTARLSIETDARQYLNGQSIKSPAASDNGWTLVTVSGIPLGWAKASNGMLKNHYPKGLRINY